MTSAPHEPTSAARTDSPRTDSVSRWAWVSWPLRDAFPASLLVPAGIAGLALLAAWTADNHLPGAAVAAVLVVALWRYFLPVGYHVDSTGITETIFRRRRHIPWHAVRRCELKRRGLVLFRERNVAPVHALRAYYVPFGRHRQIVQALAVRYLSRQRRSAAAA